MPIILRAPFASIYAVVPVRDMMLSAREKPHTHRALAADSEYLASPLKVLVDF